jgi:aryl-alcohol dehydrogenase-like predicted oxidoreductase
LANGLLVKGPSEIDMKVYCSSPEQEEQRVRQLADLRREAEAGGQSVLERALAYPRSVAGVSVALLGARNIEQLRPLLRAAGN